MAKTILEHFLSHFDKAKEYKASSRKNNHGLEIGYKEHLTGPGIKDGYFYDGSSHRMFKANMQHFGIDGSSFLDNDNKFVKAWQRTAMYRDFTKVLGGATRGIKDAFRVFEKAGCDCVRVDFAKDKAPAVAKVNYVTLECNLGSVGVLNDELTDDLSIKVNPYYVADALTLMQAAECQGVDLYVCGSLLLIKGDRDIEYLITGIK